jgi:hypothetical protein
MLVTGIAVYWPEAVPELAVGVATEELVAVATVSAVACSPDLVFRI